MTQLSLFGDN